MQRPTIVVATRSAGKLRELTPILDDAGFVVETLDTMHVPVTPVEEVLEQHDTFEGNASAKAHHFAALLPGALVLADDSGLCVDALDGRPGVRSKRWSGRTDLDGEALDEANNRFLLDALDRVGARSAASRSARYVCAMVCVRHGAMALALTARGVCEGTILPEARGVGGFGYDPWFWSADLRCSFGEASREEKAVVSHRGNALRALLVGLIPRVADSL